MAAAVHGLIAVEGTPGNAQPGQRRVQGGLVVLDADQLASYREQLTLELAILGEQKSAKISALLEEMWRDSPTLRNRIDEEAAAMAVAADPQAVLDAIKESEETLLASELMTQADLVLDPLAIDTVRPVPKAQDGPGSA